MKLKTLGKEYLKDPQWESTAKLILLSKPKIIGHWRQSKFRNHYKIEIKICREILKLHNNGNMSANAIARELQKKWFKNRIGGSRWDHSIVISIINRWLGKL